MTAFDSHRGRDGQCHGTRVAKRFDCSEIDRRIEPQALEHQLAMSDTNLMAERLVNLAQVPAGFVEKLGKQMLRSADALVHQPLGVGLHQDALAAVNRLFATLAKLVVIGLGTHNGARDTIVGPAQFAIYEQHSCAALTNRQRCDGRFDTLARERRVGVQLRNCRFHQGPAILRADDESRTDLTKFDHVGDLQHAVE